MSRLSGCAAATLVVLAAAACSGSAGGAKPPTHPPTGAATTVASVPGAAWQTVAPASVGLSAAKLDQLAATAKAGKSNCLVVVRHGKIAGEWYFRGTGPTSTQDIFSMTKSVTSTLVGIAQDRGKLTIGQSASTWIPPWKGTSAQAVTVRDLLSNDSGRQWSVVIDYLQLIRAADRTAFAIGLKQSSPPGTVWAYNNSAIQTLSQVLKGATGQPAAAYAQANLFGPLGMTDTKMTADRAGNTQTFEGIQSTCRDMARFGLLALDHGNWGGKQIVSASWLAQATGPSSTKLNAAYGYLWWLNHEGVIGNPLAAVSVAAAANPTTEHGRLVPGAPDSMYWAIGLGNQIVQVDPGSDTVVVRLGTGAANPQPPTFGPGQASKITTAVIGQ